MSAFIVEPTTINLILSWLRHEFLVHSWLRSLADRYRVDVETRGWEQRLAQAMYELNVTAVNQRYHQSKPVPEIVYSLYPFPSRIAAWKKLGCFLYQCDEGDIPHTLLYQYLEELEKQIAVLIVMSLPEYKQAEWC